MARTGSVTAYPPLERHRAEALAQRRQRLLSLAVVGPASLLIITLTASWSPPLALLLGSVALLVVFFVALPGSTSVDAGQLSGVEGEAAVLDRLSELPDDFTLLNRVKLPDETLTNGERELDFIVAGPTGLWVVEVKNTPGHIQVRPDEKHWPIARRAGCGSAPKWNSIVNPIPQVRAEISALERWLLMRGVGRRVQGLIVFSHPEVALSDVNQSPLPVLVRDQVVHFLRQAGGSAIGSSELAVVEALHPGKS